MTLIEATGTTTANAHPAPNLRVVPAPDDPGVRALGRLAARLFSEPPTTDGDVFICVRLLADTIRMEVGVLPADDLDLDLRSRRSAMRRSAGRLEALLGEVRQFADRWDWEPGPPARLSFEVDAARSPAAFLGSPSWR